MFTACYGLVEGNTALEHHPLLPTPPPVRQVEGVWFRVEGLGFMVQALKFRVWGSGLGVRVQGRPRHGQTRHLATPEEECTDGNCSAEIWSGSEEGSYLRLIALCINQL